MKKITKLKASLIDFISSIPEKEWERIELNQKIKGMKKYGRDLENAKPPKKSWVEEAMEEIIDASQYLEKAKQQEKNFNKFKILNK